MSRPEQLHGALRPCLGVRAEPDYGSKDLGRIWHDGGMWNPWWAGMWYVLGRGGGGGSVMAGKLRHRATLGMAGGGGNPEGQSGNHLGHLEMTQGGNEHRCLGSRLPLL